MDIECAVFVVVFQANAWLGTVNGSFERLEEAIWSKDFEMICARVFAQVPFVVELFASFNGVSARDAFKIVHVVYMIHSALLSAVIEHKLKLPLFLQRLCMTVEYIWQCPREYRSLLLEQLRRMLRRHRFRQEFGCFVALLKIRHVR